MGFSIITPVANQADFIVMQKALIEKFCSHPVRLIVINDSNDAADHTNSFDSDRAALIERTCLALGVECFRMPQELHKQRHKLFPRASRRADNAPSARNAASIQWALKTIAFPSRDIVMVMDSDMFPIREFGLPDMLAGANLSGVWQERTGRRFFRDRLVRYLWIGLLVLDCDKLPNRETFNMDSGMVDGLRTDAGGFLHHYLASNPTVSARAIRHLSSGTWGREQEPEWLPSSVRDFLRADIKNVSGRYYAELFDDRFLHFRAGSNWDKLDPALMRVRQESLVQALRQLVVDNPAANSLQPV